MDYQYKLGCHYISLRRLGLVTGSFFLSILLVILLADTPIALSEEGKFTKYDTPRESRLPSTLSSGERNWLKRHKVIRVAGPKAFPPFHYYEKGESAKGIAADYIRFLADVIDIELKPFNNLPWPQVLEKTKNREIDIVACAANSAERRKYLSFTQPVLSFPLVIITRKDAPFISGLNDLHGKKLACIRKVMTYNWLMRDKIKIIPQFVDTPPDALKSVAEGDSDAYIGNLAASSYLIDKYGLFNLKVAAPTPYGNYDLYIAVRSDWPELVSILNKTLRAMTPEDHTAIRNKWLSVRYEHGIRLTDIIRWGFLAVACVLPVLIVTLIWNRRLNKEIEIRKQTQKGNEKLISELQDALSKVQLLSGLLPICANCKKIRDDQGYWNQIESYVRTHSEAEFTHGICPECAKKLYPDLNLFKKNDNSQGLPS